MTLIMFCGGECTGKTTILEKYKGLGIPELVLDRAVNTKKDTVKEINARVDATNKDIRKAIMSPKLQLLDRGFVSSEVYRRVFNRCSKDYIKEFEDVKDKILIIYCWANRDTRLERWKNRHKTTDHFKAYSECIMEVFDTVMAEMVSDGWSIININTS